MQVTGTIRKNKREIPMDFRVSGEKNSATYGHHDNITLLSWTPKKNKVVLLVSSMVKSMENDKDTGKPAMVMHYNDTKGGTDVFDKLCHSYSVSHGTKRWPLRFFFGIMDQSAVNARILHTCHKINNNKPNEKVSGRENLKIIAFTLLKPLLKRRLNTIPTLRTGIRKGIESILNIQSQELEDERPTTPKRM